LENSDGISERLTNNIGLNDSPEQKNTTMCWDSFQETRKTLMEMIQANDTDSINNIVTKAQEMRLQDDHQIEKSSLLQIYDAFKQCMVGIALDVKKFFGEEQVPLPSFSSLQYYLECTDEIKNLS
jgi:hypothetical protein